MSNENYVNSYIEILTGTMQEAVLKSISLQASLKINESVINNLNAIIEEQKTINDSLHKNATSKDAETSLKYEELNKINNELVAELNVLRQQKIDFENLNKINIDLSAELSVLRQQQIECEALKTQLQQTDVFKDNLVKERDDLSVELNQLKQQKLEFENFKSQLQHLDTFKNELIKERSNHQKTKDDLEKQIKLLTEKLESKNVLPQTPIVPKVEEKIEIKQKVSKVKPAKDGGSF